MDKKDRSANILHEKEFIDIPDNTGNVGTVAVALVDRVRVGLGVFDIVTDEIPSIADTAALAEASTKSGVSVIDTGVDNTDLDSLSGELEGLLDVIGTGHGVGRGQESFDGVTLDSLGLANGEDLDGPDTLDTRNLGQVLTRVARLDVEGGAVEDVELTTNLIIDLMGVEVVAGLGVVDTVLVLNDEGAADVVGLVFGEGDELASRDQRGGGQSR